jgi:hypothetical protein
LLIELAKKTMQDYVNDLLFNEEFIIDGRYPNFSENKEEATS